MHNFFEQELAKLFGDGGIIGDPKFTGRACLGRLDKNLRTRAEFISLSVANQYDALRLTILNRTEGPVDKIVIRFADVLGVKTISGNAALKNGLVPHIREFEGKASWYVYKPVPADYGALRDAAVKYLSAFLA